MDLQYGHYVERLHQLESKAVFALSQYHTLVNLTDNPLNQTCYNISHVN